MLHEVIQRLCALSERKKNVLSVVVLLLLATLFFANVLFTDQVLVSDNLDRYWPWKHHRDYSQTKASNRLFDRLLHEYPLRLIAVRMVKSGELPLWNPYILSGTPLLATESPRGFLYPLNVIFVLTDPLRALGYASFLHLFLAAAFTFSYLRSIELSRPSSLIGSIVFGLGGYFLVYLSLVELVNTGVWLPLMLLCVEKLVREKQRLWAMVLAFAIGMVGLAGQFSILAYELLAVGLYSAWRLIPMLRVQGTAKAAQTALWLIVAVIMGVCLSAAQLIPTYEALPFFDRAHRSYEARLGRGRSPLFLATAIIPDVFGNPVDRPGWGRHAFGYNVPGYYAGGSTYAGVLPLVLGVSALILNRRRHGAFFAALAVLSVAIFVNTGLFRILYLIPIFRFGRETDAKILYFFGISVLTALGLDAVLRSSDRARRRMTRRIGLALCLSGFAAVAIVALAGLAMNSGGIGQDVELLRHWYHYNTTNVMRFVLLAFAGSLLFLLLARDRIQPYVFGVLAIILVVADLFYFGWKFNPVQSPDSLYAETDSIRFLQADRSLYRVIRGPRSKRVFPPNSLQVYGISDAQGYTPLLLDNYAQFMDLIEDGISRDRSIYPPDRAASLSSKLLDLLNVKYVISREDTREDMAWLEQSDDTIELVYDGEVKIYENKDALPRAFVVTNYEVLQDKEEIFAELTREGFDPASCVILEQEPAPHAVGADVLARESSANILEYAPSRVTVEARMSSDGFLVLSDLYYNGWRAFVDGDEGTVYKADYIFRAVQLSEGRHIVEFVFDPLSFKVGVAVSVLTLLLMASLLVSTMLRRI